VSKLSEWLRKKAGVPEVRLRDLPGGVGATVRRMEREAAVGLAETLDADSFRVLAAAVGDRQAREAKS
jgi:hypothetical protein